MNDKDFDAYDADLIDYCHRILMGRGEDYAPEEDRFHNFKTAAKLQGVYPEQALVGMMDKHVVAIHDAIREEYLRPLEWWKEKIGDNINYLRLLWGMLNEPLYPSAYVSGGKDTE